MPREITRQQAEEALEKAIRAFDWTQFGYGKELFLEEYRSLHAQLREGDELKIEVIKIDGDRHEDYPHFEIVLCTKDSKTFVVHNPSAPLYNHL